MNANEFNAQIKELIREIVDSQKDKQEKQEKPETLVNSTQQRRLDIKKNADKVTQSLDNLRICIKYILFDLEATRRERDRVKAMLSDILSNNNKPKKAEGEM